MLWEDPPLYSAVFMNVTTRVGSLTVVATPLGNAADLSARAAQALKSATIIVAEDTRTARRLLTELGAPADAARTVLSCYDANEAARAVEIADRLRAGDDVVLVS